MKQAVCYLQNIPPEHCFHIAQVWFLILDDCKFFNSDRPFMSIVDLSSFGCVMC